MASLWCLWRTLCDLGVDVPHPECMDETDTREGMTVALTLALASAHPSAMHRDSVQFLVAVALGAGVWLFMLAVVVIWMSGFGPDIVD